MGIIVVLPLELLRVLRGETCEASGIYHRVLAVIAIATLVVTGRWGTGGQEESMHQWAE